MKEEEEEEEILQAQKELLHSLLKNYPIEYLPLTDILQKISDKYKFDEFILGDKVLRPLRNKKLIEITSHALGSKRYDKYQGIANYNTKGHLTENGFNYLRLLKDNKNKDLTFYISLFSILITASSLIYNIWDKEDTKNKDLKYNSELKKELLDSVQHKTNHLFDSLTKKKP